MATGVFRRYPYLLRQQRRIIFSQPRGIATIHLPSPATLCSNGKRLHYKFYVRDAVGIRVRATIGKTIRIANSVSVAAGHIQSTTVGDSVHLVAVNDNEWVCISEVPDGSWSVV